MKQAHHKLTVDRTFLLSAEAEPVRQVAESLYPAYLKSLLEKGEEPDPKGVAVLDEGFMKSSHSRWARILGETLYAEHVMRQRGVEHTVVFFGSARIADAEPRAENHTPLSRYYGECRELAHKVTTWSLEQGTPEQPQPFVITTGGGPAIMEAGNRGATEAGGETIGLNITLPMEQFPNPYISDPFNFDFHYFFTRKFHFTYRAKCLVAFPGGFGTFDELFEILTLVQTRKIERTCKIVLYGREFWGKCVNFDYLVETGLISPKDLDLFEVHDEVEPAFETITKALQPHLDGGT